MESNEIKIKEMIVNVLENYLFNNNRREVVDSEDFQDIANDIVKELHSLSHPTNVSEENNVLYIYGEYKNHLKEMSNSGKIPLHFEQWYSLYCPTSPIKEQSDAVEFAEWAMSNDIPEGATAQQLYEQFKNKDNGVEQP